MKRLLLQILSVLLVAVQLSGCAGLSRTSVGPTPIVNAKTEIPEPLLLDVGIELFDPGEITEEDRVEKGIFPEIRNAESRFIPLQLRNTMQNTGQWGAVRVIPADTEAVDILVKGTIVESDGEVLALHITAYDATGRQWFSRTYRGEVESLAYQRLQKGGPDAFQDVYNAIANDLAAYKARLDAGEISNIRDVSELRFAAELAPEPFGGYLRRTSGGYEVARLPARNDPMMQRVLTVREREYMLIDTVNRYYDGFYEDMWDSYQGWRQARSEEAAALREVERQARNRYLLGAAAIVGAIAVAAAGNDDVDTSGLSTVMVIGGAAAIKSGMDMSAQKEIHRDAMRELGESFDAEVAPLVVHIEGETVELTGSAEAQYEQWRGMLERIYISETGLVTRGTEAGDQPGTVTQ